MPAKIVTPIKHSRTEIREWVWEYPVQTEIQPSNKRIQVVWNSEILADTKKAYKCTELGVAPYYFIPAQDVAMEYFRPSEDRTHFEWMGVASCWNVVIKKKEVTGGVISLTEPTGQYSKLLNYFAFRASRMDQVTVDGNLVRPMISEKHLGWITPDIMGPFKTEPGSDDRVKLMTQVLKERGITIGG